MLGMEGEGCPPDSAIKRSGGRGVSCAHLSLPFLGTHLWPPLVSLLCSATSSQLQHCPKCSPWLQKSRCSSPILVPLAGSTLFGAERVSLNPTLALGSICPQSLILTSVGSRKMWGVSSLSIVFQVVCKYSQGNASQ